MNEIKEIFYHHYLKLEKRKRLQAIKLYNECNYHLLNKNYIHYVIRENKQIEIENYQINDVIDQLIAIKKSLPKNSTSVFLDAPINEEDDDFQFNSCESKIYVSWIEYTIEDKSKCSKLAVNWANQSAFKMKHQPNGIDGKIAIELYKKLTQNTKKVKICK